MRVPLNRHPLFLHLVQWMIVIDFPCQLQELFRVQIHFMARQIGQEDGGFDCRSHIDQRNTCRDQKLGGLAHQHGNAQPLLHQVDQVFRPMAGKADLGLEAGLFAQIRA